MVVNYETTWYRSNQGVYNLVHARGWESAQNGGARRPPWAKGDRRGAGVPVVANRSETEWGRSAFRLRVLRGGPDDLADLADGWARPLTVTAVTQQIKPDVYPKVDDEATIVVTYPKAQAIIQASWNWPFDRKDMEVYGRTGSLVTVKRDGLIVRREGEAEAKLETAKPIAAPYGDSLTYLRAVLLDGAKVDGLSSLETNVIVTQILQAAWESAKTGKTIFITEQKF